MLEPKSKYTKSRIKRLKFTEKNRKYIRKLLALERVVLMEPLTMSFAESLDGHRKLLKELRMQEEELKRFDDLAKERQKKNTEEDRLMWKKFGGRL